MDKLNILVLHRMGDPKYWRAAVRDLEFMLPTYAAGHNYIVHAADLPLPQFIKDIDFHGIVLGPTFLCSRFRPRKRARVLKDYDFIRESNAFKIAMPQDDYNCSALLDEWMVRWNIDLVYAVCPDNWELLYPKYLSRQGSIKLGYTGYIPDHLIDRWKSPKPFIEREVDVSYRSNDLHQYYGKYGFIKAYLGDIFKSRVDGFGLVLDISTKTSDMIPGTMWYDFVENSRFCLATNSGSSLYDPHDEIRKKINLFIIDYPQATFEEVEQHCFPGLDGKCVFTAISPRNIEAALAKTVQIATPGDYSGILDAMEHYIPIEPDCANISDVLSMMFDHLKVSSIAEKCKESVLSVEALRLNNHVNDLILQIEDGVSEKKPRVTDGRVVEEFIRKHHEEVTHKSKYFWARQRAFNFAGNLAIRFGPKTVKRFIRE